MDELLTTKARSARLTIWVLVGVVAAAAGGVLWYMLAAPNTARYQPVLSAFADRQLFPNSDGKIVLSGPYASLTPHNEMFVERRPGGAFLALLPTFYPKGPAIVGLLYTSRPFDSSDLFHHGLGIDVVHPFTAVGQWSHLRIDGRLDDHWYRVSQGLE